MKPYIPLLRTRFVSFAFLAAVFAVGMVGCDSGPAPSYDDLTGTISGQVVDNATSEPIEGASITVAAGSLNTDGATFSATTDANGQFTISDVPVTRGADNSETTSTTYGIRVEPNDDTYRDAYRGEVELRFDNQGTSAVEGLVANMTFPLSKTNGTVSGRALYNDTPLSNAELGFVQQLPVQFDADGNPTQTASIRTTTTTTDSEGYFTFEDAEVGANFNIEVLIQDGATSIGGGTVPAGEEASVELGDMDVQFQVEPLKITSVTPAPESDVATTDTSITIAFNRPVVDNQYTSDQLVNDLFLWPSTAKSAKDLRPDDTLPIEISFDSTRTELTVTPNESLEDGFIYSFNGTSGFSDNHFTDAYGIPVNNTSPGNFNFSVGIDNAAPATPDVSFQDGYAPGLDYPNFDSQVNADMVLTVDNSKAEVKGYEVYARTQNMRADRTGESGQFKQVDDVSPSTSAFDQSDGIVPASEAEMDGTLEIFADINDGTFYEDDRPLSAKDGSYGAIELKVRAVSINNERSDFSDVIAVGDSTQPQVVTATATDTDSDGTDDIITVEFTEALDAGTASNVDRYTLMRSGSPSGLLDSVVSVNNVKARNQSGSNRTEVVISVTGNVNAGDELIVDDASTSNPVNDLAGNGVNPSANSHTF